MKKEACTTQNKHFWWFNSVCSVVLSSLHMQCVKSCGTLRWEHVAMTVTKQKLCVHTHSTEWDTGLLGFKETPHPESKMSHDLILLRGREVRNGKKWLKKHLESKDLLSVSSSSRQERWWWPNQSDCGGQNPLSAGGARRAGCGTTPLSESLSWFESFRSRLIQCHRPLVRIMIKKPTGWISEVVCLVKNTSRDFTLHLTFHVNVPSYHPIQEMLKETRPEIWDEHPYVQTLNASSCGPQPKWACTDQQWAQESKRWLTQTYSVTFPLTGLSRSCATGETRCCCCRTTFSSKP